eukprot:CAMPEP_0202944306 /NCGR_PEP_ID=MMETSP1395-20130829/5050_1 /ASSEMBLY_ACC=CAM_ASM_000871 /TAXON_ID=5961 /ORGANISM="Blepharisma japonicum, Strain Stock R1072" /LENGTH=106 /DNA_ID=CAMNT_0049642917 /DNA_START=306 /DNA_END=626 /DNA_ORIENTATION=+
MAGVRQLALTILEPQKGQLDLAAVQILIVPAAHATLMDIVSELRMVALVQQTKTVFLIIIVIHHLEAAKNQKAKKIHAHAVINAQLASSAMQLMDPGFAISCILKI